MKFTEHRDSNINAIKHYEHGLVKVNNLSFEDSCYITQTNTQSNWPCNHISELSMALLEQLLDEQPEVIILGTGEKQSFPAPQLFAHCAAQGVGLEVMANDAACRTYNVLTTEDREVVLALIFDNHK